MVSKITKAKKNFEERKTTVFKKAKELSTLCDVDLLLILYGSDQPDIPEVYCSKLGCANDIITKYYSGKRGGIKVVENSKKQELKHITGNNEFFDNLGIDDLTKFARVLKGKIRAVNERIDFMKQDAVGSDYYCHGVDNSQVINCFDGLDFGDVGYAPVFKGYEEKVEEIDSMQADMDSDYFQNQMLCFGGYEGKVEDMGARVDQTEDDAELQGLLMQFEVDDFGFEDFNAELLTTV